MKREGRRGEERKIGRKRGEENRKRERRGGEENRKREEKGENLFTQHALGTLSLDSDL